MLDAPHYGSARPLIADIGNLEVLASRRRRGIGSALVAEASRFLSLAGAHALLAYSSSGDDALLAFLSAQGFEVVTKTERGWSLTPR